MKIKVPFREPRHLDAKSMKLVELHDLTLTVSFPGRNLVSVTAKDDGVASQLTQKEFREVLDQVANLTEVL